MYCTKCGKELDHDGTLCDDCRNEELIYGDNAVDSYVEEVFAQNGSRMSGFGKALTSTILGFIGIILSMVALAMAEEYDAIVSIIVMFFIIAPFIIGLVFGIKSVKRFVAACKEDQVKPIPAFVLGLVGLVEATIIVCDVASVFMILAA